MRFSTPKSHITWQTISLIPIKVKILVSTKCETLEQGIPQQNPVKKLIKVDYNDIKIWMKMILK